MPALYAISNFITFVH